MSDNNYMVFLDNVGRMFIGVKDSETESAIKVKNPLIIHPEADGTGKMSIQFFPIMLREFQASKNDPTFWTFYKQNIVMADNMMLDMRLLSQYEKIFEPIRNVMPLQQNMESVQPQQAPNPSVIKLFDE